MLNRFDRLIKDRMRAVPSHVLGETLHDVSPIMCSYAIDPIREAWLELGKTKSSFTATFQFTRYQRV